jgi:hypothetical protein
MTAQVRDPICLHSVSKVSTKKRINFTAVIQMNGIAKNDRSIRDQRRFAVNQEIYKQCY